MSSVPPTAAPAAAKAIPPSDVQPFGSYLLLHAFARGGMGEVYLARLAGGVNEDQYCVLKKLRPELTQDREYVRRFIDEARVVVQLHHPNICHVFDVGRVADEYYLAMEYVSGHDARSIQNRARELGRPLPVGCVLHLVCEILEALDYAHQRNHPLTGESLHLIHRDVSPQNVLIRYDGAVKLIDFGLASSKLKMERTQPNVVMGKMAYMAPEQARGEAIDSSIDLFAVAVLAYELLSGERFYEGMLAQEIWAVVGRGDFVPRQWSTLPPELTKILSRALHAKVEKRFPSAQDFRQAILRYLDDEHPEAGQEQLSTLMAELFAEEQAREAQMMRRLESARTEELSEAIEASRSLSISLAQSEYSIHVAVAAEKTSMDGDLEADTRERQARLEKSLEAAIGGTHNDNSRTALKLVSASALATAGRAEVTEATQLRIDAFQSAQDGVPKRILLRALVVLLIGSALLGAYWLGLSASSSTSEDSRQLASEAENVASESDALSASSEPKAANQTHEGAQAKLLEKLPLAERAEPSAPQEASARTRRKRKEPKSPPRVAPTEQAIAPTLAQTDAQPGPTERSAVALVRAEEVPKKAQIEEKNTILASDVPPKAAESRPPKTQRNNAKMAKTATKPDPPKAPTAAKPNWRSFSRRERLGMLKTCSYPCRQQVSAEFVRLQIKIKSASPSERSAAEQNFDALWLNCFRSCGN